MTSITSKVGLSPADMRRQLRDAGKKVCATANTSRRCPKCPHRWVLTWMDQGIERGLCAWCGWTGTTAECPA